VYRYANQGVRWAISLFTEDDVAIPLSLKPDGVIAMVRSADAASKLASWGGPVVDTAFDIDELPFARVRLDAAAIGHTAAEHLLTLKGRSFVFVGDTRWPAARGALASYRAALQHAGQNCLIAPQAVFAGAYHVERASAQKAASWVEDLPHPSAIFCAHDAHAHRVAEACRLIGVRVPEEVAILGTLNDLFLCTASQPPLSSISCPLAALGFEAAQMLDRQMAGHRVPRRPIELPPIGVVARLSTDPTVDADPGTRSALQFIRDHHADRIGVEEIVAHSGLSRSTLERRFRELLGRGPLAELVRLRLDHVRELLTESDLAVKAVARAAGFRDARHLSATFTDKTGLTPTEFRRRNGLR
jgi:LacI family transcriptional regulator